MCNEIVFEVFIHCEGCKSEVTKCLRSFDDVHEVVIDGAAQRVIVRGKWLDPIKLLITLRKNYSKNVELIYPKPRSESIEIKQDKHDDQETLKSVELKMNMHCVACADEIKNLLERLTGVMTVEPSMENSRVTVKGNFDALKLVEYIKKRLGKRAEILNEQTLECICDCVRTEPILEDYSRQLYTVYQYRSLCVCSDDMFSDENANACTIV